MNVNIYELDRKSLDDVTDKIKIEDNIGESIHIHIRHTRLELSVDDFQTFAAKMIDSREVLKNGDY